MRLWKSAMVTIAASTALLFGLASSAQAAPGPGDDRMKSVPATWWIQEGVDSTWTHNFLITNNARITDLRIKSVSPLRFGFTAVRNTGAYAISSWFYPSVTSTQIQSYLHQNSARLISAVKHSASLYAVVMVANTGVNYRESGWCDTDFVGITTCLAGKHRLTNIWSYGPDRFVVIFVRNDEGYGWCWYAGITRSQIDTLCPGHTVLDISTNFNNTFNVIKVMYDNDGRVMDFNSLDQMKTYAQTAPQDRPLFAVPYISNNNFVRWITSFRHNS